MKISEWNLAVRLIIVNVSAVFVLGAILILVFVSFKNIETLVSSIVKKEVPRVIANSQTGNELTGIFADLLMGMFYGKEEVIKSKSRRFEEAVNTIAVRNGNPRLQQSLEEFRPQLFAILEQFASIRRISENFKKLESDFIYLLEILQDKIQQQVEVLDEGSPAMRHMEQLQAMGTRYREVFIEITLQVAELRSGKIWIVAEDHPVIADLNYLNLSLETLLAADPVISQQGKKLIEMIREYKQALIQSLNIVAEFQEQLQEVSKSKEHVMTILKETNQQITAAAMDTQKRIDDRTQLTQRVIIILSVGVLLVSMLITYSVFNTFKVDSEAKLLAQEMELARRIQTSLIPDITENFHLDFQISSGMLPADQVGGDFYDIGYDRTGNLWLAIGDVSGHGVTPGLIMMMAQTAHTTITTNFDCEARDAVVKLNEVLYKNVHERLNESHFMTFTALKYLDNGRFQHAGAHLSMIVFRHGTGKCDLIKTRGVYLNFKKDISKGTKNSEFCLNPGDALVLYTDGLTEAEDPDGKMLDIDGLVKIVEKHAHNEPTEMKEMIMADVIKWCDNKRLDDMSLVIVTMKENRVYTI